MSKANAKDGFDQCLPGSRQAYNAAVFSAKQWKAAQQAAAILAFGAAIYSCEVQLTAAMTAALLLPDPGPSERLALRCWFLCESLVTTDWLLTLNWIEGLSRRYCQCGFGIQGGS
ncbi:MAG: hypothetical protein M2R45_04881 [Verrucomicrobia subdivision 3 bacterium]|nr:hypothetical protein [Limisphaerales bacterium]MCS1414375.1 hypothetical protein [Limisphaerales bacterium]